MHRRHSRSCFQATYLIIRRHSLLQEWTSRQSSFYLQRLQLWRSMERQTQSKQFHRWVQPLGASMALSLRHCPQLHRSQLIWWNWWGSHRIATSKYWGFGLLLGPCGCAGFGLSMVVRVCMRAVQLCAAFCGRSVCEFWGQLRGLLSLLSVRMMCNDVLYSGHFTVTFFCVLHCVPSPTSPLTFDLRRFDCCTLWATAWTKQYSKGPWNFKLSRSDSIVASNRQVLQWHCH